MVLTTIFWVTGCLPLPVTALIPVFLFSVTGILTMKEITQSFFFPGLWLFFGVYVIAIAIQSTNLHIKVALKILLIIGVDPKR